MSRDIAKGARPTRYNDGGEDLPNSLDRAAGRDTDTGLVCLNDGPDCAGPVEYRMPLSGTGKSFPRCEQHWSDRLDTEDRLREDYPDSPVPPAWFDPSAAGESWDDD